MKEEVVEEHVRESEGRRILGKHVKGSERRSARKAWKIKRKKKS